MGDLPSFQSLLLEDTRTGPLSRMLRSTNAIENLNRLLGRFVRNVRRRRDGHILVRWIAAGL